MRSEKIGNLLKKVKRAGKLKTSDYLESGNFPVIDQGESEIAGYSDDPELVHSEPLPIVIFGDHTRRIKFVKQPFICGADGTQLLYPNDENMDVTYFYYALKNIDLSNYFYARHFKFLKDQYINIHSPEMQRLIVEKLKPYDELIENNRRRIVLLEDTARLLYREMFVHFRLHELQNANCTDKLPDGWNKISIGEHCPFKYGKALKAESRVAGKYPVVGSSGIIGWHQEALVKGPGIVIGRKGNVGTVFFIQDDFWPIDTTYYITGPIISEYLFLALNHTQFLNTDVAVPGLNRDFAHSREIILPQRNYLKKFQNHASPIFRKIKILNEHSTNLIRARDLLLPRLMDDRITL